MFVDGLCIGAYVEFVLSEACLRLIGRCCLVVVSVIGLPDLPGFAANEKPLGLVTQTQQARMENAKLAVGTAVYPGDTVETDTGGTLRLKLGTNQLYLFARDLCVSRDAGCR